MTAHWLPERRLLTFELKTLDGKNFSLERRACPRPGGAGFFQSSCPDMPVCASHFRAAAQSVRAEEMSPWSEFRKTTASETAAFKKQFGDHFPCAARRHPFISRLECLRTDQCPQHFLDRAGWRDRSFQRGLGQGRFRIDQSQDGGNGKGRAADDLQARRRCAGFPRWLRIEELGAGRRPN